MRSTAAKEKHGYRNRSFRINEEVSKLFAIYKCLFIPYLLRLARHPSVIERTAAEFVITIVAASVTSTATDCTVASPFSNFFNLE